MLGFGMVAVVLGIVVAIVLKRLDIKERNMWDEMAEKNKDKWL